MKEILFYTDTDIEHGKRRNGKPIIHKHERPLRIIVKPEALYVKDIDGRLINATGISVAFATLLNTKRQHQFLPTRDTLFGGQVWVLSPKLNTKVR